MEVIKARSLDKNIGDKVSLLRPPSNADILGSQLLGYRVYIRDIQCQGRGEPCQDSQKKTISDPTATHARIGLLSMFLDVDSKDKFCTWT